MRPTIAAFLVSALFLGPSGACGQARPGVVFAHGTDHTPSIPIALASGKVHVPVDIGDLDPVWMLLDTGANATILDRSLAEQLDLPLRGHTTGNQAAGKKRFSIWFSRIDGLDLPGVRLPAQRVAVIERRTQGANGHPSQGLLGADFFDRLVVEIDYGAKTLTLHDPETYRYTGDGVVLPIDFDDNRKVRVAGRLTLAGKSFDVTFSVDTGSRGILALSRPFVDRSGLAAVLDRGTLQVVGVGIGGPVEHRLVRADQLALGGFTFDDVAIEVPPEDASGAYLRPGRDGILGARLLSRFRVIFDYPRARMILERREAADAPLPVDASGLFLEAPGPGYDRIQVLAVTPGSPAAGAGIEVGDVIASVDGTEASTLGLDGVRARLWAAGAHVTLAVERRGERRTVRVALRAPV